MGNCSRKMKKSVNSWYNNNRNGAIRLGSPVSCPRCNQIFEPNTSFNIVNAHFDNCLGAQGTFTNVEPSSTSSSVDLNQINFILNNVPPPTNGEKYIWIKKRGPNNTANWERVLATSNKTEDHVENMSLKSAKELSFEDKQKWFLCQISKNRIPWTYGADQLVINRQNLLETTLTGLKRVNLHKEVKIVFDNEQRVNDAGGLMREFVHLICLQVFAGDKELFVRTDTQEVIYRMNPRMPDTTDNLQLYKLIGKIIGKAMFEQITIPVQLDHLLLRQIINREFTLEDLLHYDKQLYNSLSYIQNNTIGNSDIFDECFVTYSPIDGSQVELVHNGSNIKITDQNKAEFIKLQLEWIGQKFIQKKLNAFLEGLYQVISKETFHAFSVEELEMVINGLPFIDIHDWEANTAYKGLYSKNHQAVKWFWELMKELNQDQLSKFFHFCTGSSRVPVEGFRALQSNRQNLQKFTIESVKYVSEKTGLSAHTCFNRLELPMYTKKEIMRQHLMSILKADFIGVFGIE